MFWKRTPLPPEPEPVPLRTEKTDYPYGMCVETERGFFLIRDKVRFRISSDRILWSWRFDPVETTESAVKHFAIAGKLGFRDGTLINNLADGKMYLVSKNKKRHITSPDAFDKYGLHLSDMLTVSAEEANLHEDGDDLN